MVLSKNLKRQILEAKRQILRRYNDVLGLVVIGSVAEGDYKKNSDIDIVCIKKRKIKIDVQLKLADSISNKIQLVIFSKKQIFEHFKYSTTMAYSFKNGIPVYQKDGFVKSLFEKRLSRPSKIWMKRWFRHWLRFYQFAIFEKRRNKRLHKKFCKYKCFCEINDYLERATVNFAILYLETQGVIPTTKSKILAGLSNSGNERFRKGLKIALNAYHKDRGLNIKEAATVFYTADWLKQRLKGLL